MKEYQNISHVFGPVYNSESRILILGSFPSVKSREQAFFYGHPRNRFWKVLAAVLKEEEPQTVEEKKAMLFRRGVAVYDVIEQCSIIGSSDSSIKDVVPADLGKIVGESQIQKVYTNGKTAGKLYKKYQDKEMNLPMEELPSTSPANAAYSLEKLTEIWSRARTCSANHAWGIQENNRKIRIKVFSKRHTISECNTKKEAVRNDGTGRDDPAVTGV